MDMITCTVCKEIKDKSLFYPSNIRSKDGSSGRCCACVIQYINDNADSISSRNKQYKINYYEKNKEMCLARSKAWHSENSAEVAIRNRLRKYNITEDKYQEMLITQKNSCDSCGDLFLDKICVDHKKGTVSYRHLLCTSCNLALGQQKEDPIRLRKLADYAEKIAREAK
mgnify:CR=1 FL=1